MKVHIQLTAAESAHLAHLIDLARSHADTLGIDASRRCDDAAECVAGLLGSTLGERPPFDPDKPERMVNRDGRPTDDPIDGHTADDLDAYDQLRD